MLKFKNITTQEKKPYLNNLNLNIAKGKFVLLRYRSELEKNKIIDLICQLDIPKSGSVVIGGTDLTKFKRRSKIIHKRIGISFDNFKLIETKNVLANIVLPLEIHTKLSRKKQIEIGEEKLKTFGLLNKKNNCLTTLNLEEKQRLNIARSMILNPELIILDNPQSYLKHDKIENLVEHLKTLNNRGKTIVIFSNDKKIEKFLNCDKYILEKGAISNV